MRIRPATTADATAIAAIYAPYVTGTTISFEEIAPSPAEMATRIAAILPHFPYLVAEADGAIAGYAYCSQHRTRAAYRTSVDVAIYVDAAAHGRGIGRALYTDLLEAARQSGYHAAFAGIALPNTPSIALHKAMGFTLVGIYREVGCKFGRWLDVAWYQRLL